MMPALRTFAWLLLALGLILQLWLKDRHLAWAAFFYAMPKPVLICAALFLTAAARARWQRMTAAAAWISLTSWWLSVSWSRGATAEKAAAGRQEVTLLYWNLCRPHEVDQEAVALVKELQPHIVGFVEPGKTVGTLLASYEKLLPGYTVAWMPRGILWLSRVPSRYRERGKLDGLGAYARFEVDGLGPTFPVVIADVTPSFVRSRAPQLREVLAQSQGRADAILAGDFNTPLESVFFDAYRQSLIPALEVNHRGLRETWPLGLPLLSIDHVWLGHEWQVLEARKIWRLTGSDHAAIYVRLQRR
jgi:endonuclease/exonuclease/phosphatase (EEP) superfamily protein YafD